MKNSYIVGSPPYANLSQHPDPVRVGKENMIKNWTQAQQAGGKHDK
jgi:hypothetical protein